MIMNPIMFILQLTNSQVMAYKVEQQKVPPLPI